MPNLAHLEAILGQLGQAKGPIRAILGHLKAILGVLGRLGAVFGPSGGRFGVVLGLQNLEKT